MTKTITLAHGNGGAENNELIKEVFYDAFKNEILEQIENNEKTELLELLRKLNDFHSHVYSEYKRFNIDEILERSAI